MGKKKVFIPTKYYLPGENAGGPIQSIKNLIDRTHNEIDYYISTLNHDFNSNEKYDIDINEWIEREGYKIKYTEIQSLNSILSDIKEIKPEYIYLNSLFSPTSILIIHLYKFNLINNVKIVLAPRGELGRGALSQKRLKKKIYLKYSKLLNLYEGITFQATNKFEEKDIKSVFTNEIKIAMDLPKEIKKKKNYNNKKSKELKLIFLSRINPMKNLDYALSSLKNVRRKVDFDIYGPLEDQEYYSKCLKIDLPDNINVKYFGQVKNENVTEIISNYDLFFLPTKGENFGHVIAESLMAGVPVLISDRTQWNNLEKYGVGFNVSLNNMEEYTRVIENFKIKEIEYSQFLLYIDSILNFEKAIKDSLRLFE